MKPLTDFAASLGNLALNNSVETAGSFYSAYQRYLVPNEEKVGVSVALGSRLIQKSALATSAGQEAITNALVNISQSVSFPSGTLDPRKLTYGAPLQILVTAPSSYKLPPEGDTSSITPAWRTATWHVIAAVGMSNTATAAEYAAGFQQAHGFAELLTSVAGEGSGAYQNEADTFQSDYVEAFWGESNWGRLSAIKKVVDPGNLLTCRQCVGWVEGSARFGCYPDVE